jgi:transcriptional regulator with XRE-family HTH domain
MPNIASILKSEISRVARKEVRAQTQSLKKAAAAYRADIAALKRRVQALEQALRRLERLGTRQPPPPAADGAAQSIRFSAKSLASQRRRLGLSAADCGRLLGASSLSVYKWESGQARPRAKFIAAIAGLRSLGKKEAAAQLIALGKGD